MKTERQYPYVTLTKKGERFISAGHVWVYGEEIISESGDIQNGEICDVFSEKRTYLGSGFYNSNSKIRVRILSKNANDKYDDAFFARRVRYAIDYRRTVMRGDISNCRLIFGEADGLPGVTLDKFGDILVFQILSYGMEIRKQLIYTLAKNILTEYGETVSGIYERNDVAVRQLEGMVEGKGWADGFAHPDVTTSEICENGIKYIVDFENGQKTGFFLDQKFNRLEVARLAKGKSVLDCFTHTGSFALNAAMGGAAHVTAVDISEKAINDAKENARRNGLSDVMDFAVADVFDYLDELRIKKHGYDFIILDPPAFTKSRKTVNNAHKGYREINTKALRLLPRGGYFATCSCSHFMKDELFREMLYESARDAGVTLKQIEARQQSPDHPIIWGVPETDYLKFYIFQIV